MHPRPLLAALALGPVLVVSLVRAASEPASPVSAGASVSAPAPSSSGAQRGWLAGVFGAGPGAAASGPGASASALRPAPEASASTRLLAVVGAASTPPASPPPVVGPPPVSSGVQIFIRTGVSLPLGRFSSGDRSLSDGIQGALPLIVDVGGKPFDRIFVGAYLGFNPGLVGKPYRDACTGGVSCGANNVRLGLEVQFHLFPAAHYNPWIGVGVGIEATTIAVDSNDTSTDTAAVTQARAGAGSFQGPELLHLMGGFDNRISETFGIGPFVAMTVGRYETVTARNSVGVNRTLAITNPSTHEWLMAGVRLVLFP